jgi:hypothetical protein
VAGDTAPMKYRGMPVNTDRCIHGRG